MTKATPQMSGLEPEEMTSHEATMVLPQSPPTFAWLVVLNTYRRGRLYRLRQPELTLGRAENNDVVLEDALVSRFHARIVVEEVPGSYQCFLQDLASANGSFVNGQRVTRQLLQDEDRVNLGEIHFVFKQLPRL